ncbi:MAG TPA: hypothetical protein VK737_06650 [Opitutales bacterium]|jgi:hypothetical protein|nr:hypothetical protein [Opitutales bacterium]
MKKVLIFIAGVIFGAAFYAGGQSMFSHAPAPDTGADTKAIATAKDILAHQKEREAALDKRELDLKLAAANLDVAKNAPAADANTDNGAKTASSGFTDMAKAAIKQQVDMQMVALKTRLKLSDDQSAAIQDLMDKQTQVAQDMMEKMFSGKMTKDELQQAMKDQGATPADMDKQLQSILTSDQYASYQGYQNDQKKSAAEAAANGELMQIQSSLQLTDAQKDKVFSAIYQQYSQQMGVDGAQASNASIDDQMEAKKAALQAVLTPEQFDGYSKFVDSQKSMINALTGGSQAAGTGQ